LKFSFSRFCLLILCSLSLGLNYAIADPYPAKPVGYVNDFAGLLDQGFAAQLEQKLKTYRDTTSNVIVVATLTTLEDQAIEDVATKMFTDWKMWEGDRKNGVLVLIVPSEKKIRIEVGYGLEGAVPDIMAGRIISNIIQPAFREGRFEDGIDKATSAIMALAAGEYDAVDSMSAEGDGSGSLVFLFIVFIIIYMIVQNRKRHGSNNSHSGHQRRSGSHISYGPSIVWGSGFGSSRGGGFGGGGFGGFGGGGGFGSGGGGASGGW
jgi:uncharacterized protein